MSGHNRCKLSDRGFSFKDVSHSIVDHVPFSHAVCTENLSSGVVVVKSAKDGVRFDASDSLNRTGSRRILVQGSMRSEIIIIIGVTFQNSA